MPVWDKEHFSRFYSFPIAYEWGHHSSKPPVVLHYHNFSVGRPQADFYAPKLADLCGMGSGSRVATIGSGFNWTGRGLLQHRGVQSTAIDTSEYILANADETEEAELREIILGTGEDPDSFTVPDTPRARALGWAGFNLLDLVMRGGRSNPQRRAHGVIHSEDLSIPAGRRKVAAQGRFNFVLSEECLNSVDDDTALSICDAAEALASDHGAPDCKIIHALSPYQEGFRQAPELNWKTYTGWREFLDSNGFYTHYVLPTVTAYGQTPEGDGLVEGYGGLI